jgi:hypothetical protein
MNLFEPTPAGSAAAAALVVAGAPVFSAGLRVLRLRRRLSELTERPLAEVPSGFVLLRGRLLLDSPLVGPLSGKPCAGYDLEVRGSGASARIHERRPFRLTSDRVVAQVLGEDGTWQMAVSAERQFARGEATSQNLAALLQRSAEAAWIGRAGSFTVTERALIASQECWVIGQATHARPLDLPLELESLLEKTGTDDLSHVLASHPEPSEPDVWVRADGHLEFLRVSDQRPNPGELAPPPWGLVLIAAGPLLSLTGLVYLARAAERWRALLGG